MTEKQAVKQSADLLRSIIRSIDKRLEYNFIESAQEGRFSLRLTIRGRAGLVSLRSADLQAALSDDVQKNAIRQKLKSTRDHLLSNYVKDVMERNIARMLARPSSGESNAKTSFFYRRPRERRW